MITDGVTSQKVHHHRLIMTTMMAAAGQTCALDAHLLCRCNLASPLRLHPVTIRPVAVAAQPSKVQVTTRAGRHHHRRHRRRLCLVASALTIGATDRSSWSTYARSSSQYVTTRDEPLSSHGPPCHRMNNACSESKLQVCHHDATRYSMGSVEIRQVISAFEQTASHGMSASPVSPSLQ